MVVPFTVMFESWPQQLKLLAMRISAKNPAAAGSSGSEKLMAVLSPEELLKPSRMPTVDTGRDGSE